MGIFGSTYLCALILRLLRPLTTERLILARGTEGLIDGCTSAGHEQVTQEVGVLLTVGQKSRWLTCRVAGSAAEFRNLGLKQ